MNTNPIIGTEDGEKMRDRGGGISGSQQQQQQIGGMFPHPVFEHSYFLWKKNVTLFERLLKLTDECIGHTIFRSRQHQFRQDRTGVIVFVETALDLISRCCSYKHLRVCSSETQGESCSVQSYRSETDHISYTVDYIEYISRICSEIEKLTNMNKNKKTVGTSYGSTSYSNTPYGSTSTKIHEGGKVDLEYQWSTKSQTQQQQQSSGVSEPITKPSIDITDIPGWFLCPGAAFLSDSLGTGYIASLEFDVDGIDVLSRRAMNIATNRGEGTVARHMFDVSPHKTCRRLLTRGGVSIPPTCTPTGSITMNSRLSMFVPKKFYDDFRTEIRCLCTDMIRTEEISSTFKPVSYGGYTVSSIVGSGMCGGATTQKRSQKAMSKQGMEDQFVGDTVSRDTVSRDTVLNGDRIGLLSPTENSVSGNCTVNKSTGVPLRTKNSTADVGVPMWLPSDATVIREGVAATVIRGKNVRSSDTTNRWNMLRTDALSLVGDRLPIRHPDVKRRRVARKQSHLSGQNAIRSIQRGWRTSASSSLAGRRRRTKQGGSVSGTIDEEGDEDEEDGDDVQNDVSELIDDILDNEPISHVLKEDIHKIVQSAITDDDTYRDTNSGSVGVSTFGYRDVDEDEEEDDFDDDADTREGQKNWGFHASWYESAIERDRQECGVTNETIEQYMDSVQDSSKQKKFEKSSTDGSIPGNVGQKPDIPRRSTNGSSGCISRDDITTAEYLRYVEEAEHNPITSAWVDLIATTSSCVTSGSPWMTLVAPCGCTIELIAKIIRIVRRYVARRQSTKRGQKILRCDPEAHLSMSTDSIIAFSVDIACGTISRTTCGSKRLQDVVAGDIECFVTIATNISKAINSLSIGESVSIVRGLSSDLSLRVWTQALSVARDSIGKSYIRSKPLPGPPQAWYMCRAERIWTQSDAIRLALSTDMFGRADDICAAARLLGHEPLCSATTIPDIQCHTTIIGENEENTHLLQKDSDTFGIYIRPPSGWGCDAAWAASLSMGILETDNKMVGMCVQLNGSKAIIVLPKNGQTRGEVSENVSDNDCTQKKKKENKNRGDPVRRDGMDGFLTGVLCYILGSGNSAMADCTLLYPIVFMVLTCGYSASCIQSERVEESQEVMDTDDSSCHCCKNLQSPSDSCSCKNSAPSSAGKWSYFWRRRQMHIAAPGSGLGGGGGGVGETSDRKAQGQWDKLIWSAVAFLSDISMASYSGTDDIYCDTPLCADAGSIRPGEPMFFAHTLFGRLLVLAHTPIETEHQSDKIDEDRENMYRRGIVCMARPKRLWTITTSCAIRLLQMSDVSDSGLTFICDTLRTALLSGGIEGRKMYQEKVPVPTEDRIMIAKECSRADRTLANVQLMALSVISTATATDVLLSVALAPPLLDNDTPRAFHGALDRYRPCFESQVEVATKRISSVPRPPIIQGTAACGERPVIVQQLATDVVPRCITPILSAIVSEFMSCSVNIIRIRQKSQSEKEEGECESNIVDVLDPIALEAVDRALAFMHISELRRSEAFRKKMESGTFRDAIDVYRRHDNEKPNVSSNECVATMTNMTEACGDAWKKGGIPIAINSCNGQILGTDVYIPIADHPFSLADANPISCFSCGKSVFPRTQGDVDCGNVLPPKHGPLMSEIMHAVNGVPVFGYARPRESFLSVSGNGTTYRGGHCSTGSSTASEVGLRAAPRETNIDYQTAVIQNICKSAKKREEATRQSHRSTVVHTRQRPDSMTVIVDAQTKTNVSSSDKNYQNTFEQSIPQHTPRQSQPYISPVTMRPDSTVKVTDISPRVVHPNIVHPNIIQQNCVPPIQLQGQSVAIQDKQRDGFATEIDNSSSGEAIRQDVHGDESFSYQSSQKTLGLYSLMNSEEITNRLSAIKKSLQQNKQ